MIRSMTGFGDAERETAAGTLRVELRTVNHRHLNANFRLPNAMLRWEGEMREWLRGYFQRGHVNCAIRLEPPPGAPRGLRLDAERVQSYLALLNELRERYGVVGEPDLGLVARFPDVFARDEAAEETPVEVAMEDLRAVVAEAAARCVVMREQEGRRLHDDLEGRIQAIEAALAVVEERAPERLVSERDRLRRAVQELAAGVALDPDRLAQEVAFLAERWDVNEELVRFRSHNALFRELLDAEAAEPVGKRLSFLVQEMHREANTIGSKANDAGIAHRVVAIKDEVERLREQVENVE
jgi:uncharacterized protein (TIGR00255 family)